MTPYFIVFAVPNGADVKSNVNLQSLTRYRDLLDLGANSSSKTWQNVHKTNTKGAKKAQEQNKRREYNLCETPVFM